MMRLGSTFERLRNACSRSIIISASSAMPYIGSVSVTRRKTRKLVTHLLLALLQAQASWELHEVLVYACYDTCD